VSRSVSAQMYILFCNLVYFVQKIPWNPTLDDCKLSQQLAILNLVSGRNTVKVACDAKQIRKFPPRCPLAPSKITEIPFAVVQCGLPQKTGASWWPLEKQEHVYRIIGSNV
jgi:hypothetical protein